jgi:hypothetical protein
MKTIHQYVNVKDGRRYYFSLKPLYCSKCDKHLFDFVAVHFNWGKKKSYLHELCFDCSEKHIPEGQAEEKIIMSVVHEKPRNSKLVVITPPQLQNHTKDDSVFSNTLDAPKINNYAKRSFHPEYTVLDDSAPAQIGAPIDEEAEITKEKILELEEDVNALLLGFKNEKILIGDEEEQKRLEE